MTILSVALLAVGYTAIAGQQQQRHADEYSRAARLAEDLMEEILSLSYTDPDATPAFGPETGEGTRKNVDDVDDFHGFNEPAGNLRDATDAKYGSAEQAFSRSVTVTAGGQAIADLGRTIGGVTVTVQVRDARGVVWQFDRFIPKP